MLINYKIVELNKSISSNERGFELTQEYRLVDI